MVMLIKFRTLRRLCLIALALALLVPVVLIVAHAAYYRGRAYRDRVAGDLAESLGTRVALGHVARTGRHDLCLQAITIGGTRQAPLITAAQGALRRDTADPRRLALVLEDAHLRLRARRDLDEVLSLVATGRRDQPLLASVRLRAAAVTAEADFQLDAEALDADLDFGRSPAGGSASVRLRRGGQVVGRIAAQTSNTTAAVHLEEMPAAVLQAAGLATDLPLGPGRVSGDLLAAQGSVTVDVRVTDLETARLAAGFGFPGVSGPVTVVLTGTFGENGGLWPTRVRILDGGGRPSQGFAYRSRRRGLEYGAALESGPARHAVLQHLQADPPALRRLAYLLAAETLDGMDTGDLLLIDRLDATVTVEGDRVTVSGGALEPAGTILSGARRGGTPRPLLRLNRTRFRLGELAERLAEVRSGKADAPPEDVGLTTQALSRPASRPSP